MEFRATNQELFDIYISSEEKTLDKLNEYLNNKYDLSSELSLEITEKLSCFFFPLFVRT